MSEKKYTITLTFEELQHIKEAINNRDMHYYEDFVEYAQDQDKEYKEYQEKQEKIIKKLNKRIQKKWDKIFN